MIRLKEILIENDIKIVYHGTFESNKNDILKNGLIPNHKINWPDWSEEGYVYVNDNPKMTLQWMKDLINEKNLDIDDIIILKIRVDEKLLKIDFESNIGTDYKIKNIIPPQNISIFGEYEPVLNTKGKIINFKKL